MAEKKLMKGNEAFAAAAINAGKYEDASKMLGNATPYSDASAAVGLALTHLKQAVPA